MARGEFDAAVAAPLAAEQHGLEVIADDVADNAGAVTRFALVAPPGPPPAPTGNDRTTLAATTQNRPGSLLGLLTELAVRGIDLTRIESRPIKDRHAEYWFHLDCTGHVAEPAMGEALAALHRRCDRVRFLGSYPRAGDGTARPVRASARRRSPAGADADGFAASQQLAGRPARRGCRREARFLARHGRTDGNVAPHPRLAAAGCAARRARPRAGRARSASGWRTSPSRRCTPPAPPGPSRRRAPVAAAHGLAVEVIDGVHEVLVGDLEGRSDDAAREPFDDVYEAWWQRRPGRPPARRGVGPRPAGALPACRRADRRRRRRRGDGTSTAPSCWSATAPRSGWGPPRCSGDTAETQYVPNTGLVVLRPEPRRGRLGAGALGRRPSRWPATSRAGGAAGLIRGPRQPQPSSCRVSSSMPKWWATSCTTVTATSSHHLVASAQMSRMASW